MDHSPVKIKALALADHDLWAHLWQNYLTFYETNLPSSTTETTWRNLLDDDIPVYGFGAWREDVLVGITHVVLHPNTWNTNACCYLEDLYVANNVCGQGVGRALIEHVYSFVSTGRHKKATPPLVNSMMPLRLRQIWFSTVRTYKE